MADFPLQFTIDVTYPHKRTERLSCKETLRIIPGKRTIYDAVWNDRDVIVKVFSHKLSARRHLKRECQGLMGLAKRDINIPQTLFYGRKKDGKWALVAEKIADSSSVLELFRKSEDPVQKLELLIMLGRELAKQHIKGVLQKDLHLGNFLLQGDKIFWLDAARMCFLASEVGRKTSVAQLAILVAWLPDSPNEAIKKICEEYFKARAWHFDKPDEILVKKELKLHIKRAIRRGLKKTLRTSKNYLKITYKQNIVVFDREFCTEDQIHDFIEQLDTMMNAGQILKDGNTCYVSRLIWNGKNVVIKRYNHKGFIHSLRHTIKGSRARSCWIHGHRLGMLNIATPKPLAFIEEKKNAFTWKSYIVTEYVEGRRLYDFLRDKSVTEKQGLDAIQQVKEVLADMGKFHITHRDLKHTNIIITKNGPILTDLDAMRIHKWKRYVKLRQSKDLERFTKYK